MQDSEEKAAPRFKPVPWSGLETAADVELWIEEHNRSMQDNIGRNESGYGVCFTLAEGGDVFLQTTQDGYLVLDVTPDADWIAPLIMAVAGIERPKASVWIMPDDKLIELMMGLSSLIASSILVVGHHFGARHRKQPLPR
ncbi:hypothetical protein [Rugamonas sp.]|uniref:hypothetical protein n=1 Tax=Rugamonas sp. TaxID=1926287 RepID=UPI0025F51C18|nr:hypothetical protein [Rugamonas sp.]